MHFKKMRILVVPCTIAQMKEEKKLYMMMKNFGGGEGVGKGSNFTLKFLAIFAIVKCVAFRENSDSICNFFMRGLRTGVSFQSDYKF